MNLLKYIGIFIFVYTLSGFTSDNSTEKEIEYKIVAKGVSYAIDFKGENFFTLTDRAAFDNFWLTVYGDYTKQPYLNMNDSKLIVIPAEYTVDKITETNENIKMYSTYRERKTGFTNFPVPVPPPPPPGFKIVCIASNNKEIKFFQRDAEPVSTISPYGN